MFLNECEVVLVDRMGRDLDIANAARISRYVENREPSDKDAILIDNLAKHGHSTPFEHVVFKFKISCPMYIARQIFRHRTFSYNELSRMYTSKDIEFYIEENLFENAKSFQMRNEIPVNQEVVDYYKMTLKMFCKDADRLYQEYLKMGIANEYARAILPQNLMTEFVMTGNLRNWMHFIKLRENNYNNIEIVRIANVLLSEINKYCPIACEALHKYSI